MPAASEHAGGQLARLDPLARAGIFARLQRSAGNGATRTLARAPGDEWASGGSSAGSGWTSGGGSSAGSQWTGGGGSATTSAGAGASSGGGSPSTWDDIVQGASDAWDTAKQTVSDLWEGAKEKAGELEQGVEKAVEDGGAADAYHDPFLPWPSKDHPTVHYIRLKGCTQEWLLAQGYRYVDTEQIKKDPPHWVEHWVHPETGDVVYRYVHADTDVDDPVEGEKAIGGEHPAVVSLRGWTDMVEAGVAKDEELAAAARAAIGTPEYDELKSQFNAHHGSTVALGIGVALKLKDWTDQVGDDPTAKRALQVEVDRMVPLMERLKAVGADLPRAANEPEPEPDEEPKPDDDTRDEQEE